MKISTLFASALFILASACKAAEPQGMDDFFQTQSNSPIVISHNSLLENDVDADGDALRIIFVDDWINGVAQYSANAITFTPAQDFNGQAQFTYVISDGTEDGYEGLGYGFAYINVTPAQGSPLTANADNFTSTSTSLTLNFSQLTANDTSPEGSESINITEFQAPQFGTLVANFTEQQITYTTAENFIGTDIFTYSISDGTDTATAQVAIDVQITPPSNHAPHAVDDFYSMTQDSVLQLTIEELVANDIDPDGDTLSIIIVDDWEHGQAALSATEGTVSFTAEPGFVGQALFIYTITDGHHVNYDGLGWGVVYIDITAASTPTPTPTATPSVTPTPTISPTSTPTPSPTTEPTPTPIPERDGLRTYIFGHSLINHAGPDTAVPHYMFELSESAGKTYRFSGQYGFLRNHANNDPVPQWGWSHIPEIWSDDSSISFSDVDFDTMLFTAGNFIQWLYPSDPWWGETELSPLDTTLQLIDMVNTLEPGIEIYIYENWQDMGGMGVTFPPGPNLQQLSAYHAETVNSAEGGFHRWWLDYQDLISAARPDLKIKMIPAGPILSRLLTTAPLNSIPVLELYEDDAPHGRPNIYFLAGLVTYMAMYGEPAPENYSVPTNLSPLIQDNYNYIVDFIWQELNNFNYADGASRVW